MMEVGYENQVNPNLDLGLLDRYFIDKYHSIILRKEKVKAHIKKILSKRGVGARAKILTIGGGPAREWLELADEVSKRTVARVDLTYLDQDSDAMAFASTRLDKNPLIASVEYRKESLFEFSRPSTWSNRSNTYDLIYGIGIADYFYDRVLVGIVAKALLVARRGGTVLITHKDHDAFPFVPADWLCDWTFVHRTEKDFTRVLRNAIQESKVVAKLKVDHESSGEILFGHLTV